MRQRCRARFRADHGGRSVTATSVSELNWCCECHVVVHGSTLIASSEPSVCLQSAGLWDDSCARGGNDRRGKQMPRVLFRWLIFEAIRWLRVQSKWNNYACACIQRYDKTYGDVYDKNHIIRSILSVLAYFAQSGGVRREQWTNRHTTALKGKHESSQYRVCSSSSNAHQCSHEAGRTDDADDSRVIATTCTRRRCHIKLSPLYKNSPREK